MGEISREIGHRIRNFRKSRHMTLDELAEVVCKNKSTLSKYENGEIILDIETIYEKVVTEKQCVSLKELDVNGSDLIKIGIQPGKEIGETLNRLLEIVIENPELNKKEILLKKVTI